MSWEAIFGSLGLLAEVEGESGVSGDAEAEVGRPARGWMGGNRFSCLDFLLGEVGGEEDEERGAGATRLELLGERRGLAKVLAEWERGEEDGGSMVSRFSSNLSLSFFFESGLVFGDRGRLEDSSFSFSCPACCMHVSTSCYIGQVALTLLEGVLWDWQCWQIGVFGPGGCAL